MASIKTDNFNFQGVGVVVSTSVFVPPPPSFDVPRLIVQIDPDINAPQVLIENVLSNEPTRLEYTVTLNVQDAITGNVQVFNTNQSENYNTLTFDPVTNIAELADLSNLNPADGDLEVEVEFFWENINGTVIQQSLVSETLELILGCTDSNSNNYISDANIDDGSCVLLQHIAPQLVMGGQSFGSLVLVLA